MRLLFKNKKCISLLIATLLVSGLYAVDQQKTEFRTGRLSNGFTYYVRHSIGSPGEAGVYFVQNVGSMMEESNQRGLAHFLEHMAFNASQNFPGQIDRFMQRNNITRYNAYTAYDETVYNIDNIPTSNKVLMDSCLLVIRDWCHYLTLPEAGIEKERSIILEERRMRRDVMERVREQIVGDMYNNSRYAERTTIGDLDVLENFKRNDLVDYYNRWYRPDLQAIIVAGDVNVAEVEKFIVDNFSNNPVTENPEPRPIYTIDNHAEPKYKRVVDKEMGGVVMEFSQRIAKPQTAKTPAELVERILLREMFNGMVQNRMGKAASVEEPAYSEASMEFSELVRGYNVFSISITPHPDRDFRAVYQVFKVLETLRKHGFTQYEFDVARKAMLRQSEVFSRNLSRVGYDVDVALCQSNFLNSTPIIEPTQRFALEKKAFETMTVADINNWMKEWLDRSENKVFVVTGTEEKYAYLSLEDILSAEEDVRDSEPEQMSFAADTARLVDFELTPSKALSERKTPIGDAVEWQFANGATVYYKSADEGIGSFRFAANSKGGTSLLEAIDIPSATAVGSLAFASGVYNTDRSAMIELMQSCDMSMNVILQSFGESIRGESATDDAERFFELLHLGMTHPRFDEPEFARYVNELKISLDTRRKSDMDYVQDTVKTLFNRPSPRERELDSAYIADLSLDRIKRIFGERFANAADFTYYIVGDIGYDDAKEMAEKYIATLPSATSHKKEKYVVHPSSSIKDDIKREFCINMPDSKAIVDVMISNSIKLDREQAVAFWLMGSVLNSRCTDEIREKRGGSYNISVETRNNELSEPRQWLTIHFETSVDKLEEMKSAVYKELDDMKKFGVSDADVASIVSTQKQRLASKRQDTEFWMSALRAYCEDNVDQTAENYHTVVLDRLTPKSVQKIVDRFLKGSRKAEIVVRSKDEGIKVENDK